MSIASEISRLQGAKADIKAAIEAKGVSVPSAASIDTYDTYIAQISGGGGGCPLPTGYTRLDYVSTNSAAYVDTGVAGSSALTITTRFAWDVYVQYGAIYGNYIDESHRANRIIIANGSYQAYVGAGNNLATTVSNCYRFAIHTAVVDSSNIYLDGVMTGVGAQALTSNTNNICLGNRSLTTPSNRDIGLRIYFFIVESGGAEVLHYIPCKRDNDSKAGFYDIVANAFVPSSTATDFVAGPETV